MSQNETVFGEVAGSKFVFCSAVYIVLGANN